MAKKYYWGCEVIELGDKGEIVVKGDKLPKENMNLDFGEKAEVIAFNYNYRTKEYLNPNLDDEFKAYVVKDDEIEIPKDFIKVAEFSDTVEIFTGYDVKKLYFPGCKIQFLRRYKHELIIKVAKLSDITEKERELIKELSYHIEGKPITKEEILEKVGNCLVDIEYNSLDLIEVDLNTATRGYKLYITIDTLDRVLRVDADKMRDGYILTSRIV